jgi:phage terminase large subunit-like protein
MAKTAKHPVVAYCHGVLDGSVPASVMIQLAVQRHIRDLETGSQRGLHFDRQAAEYAVKYFGFLKHSKGEWAGKTFEPAAWQQFVLWSLFGWKRADGLRRFRTAFVEVPRKNGKSTLIAGIGLYLLTADGEPGAEVYSAATKREQAKITWSEAVRMVAASPVLSNMVQHWRASDTLAVEATASKFVPLGADANTMDGLNIHGALIDELHAHSTSAVVDVLDTATGARRQPLICEITTAGYDRGSVCYQHYLYSRQVLQRTIEDDRWFAYIAELDEGDDWSDEANWAKANPNLGVSVRLDDLRAKADKARNMPAALNGFLRLHLDVWTQQSDRWIDLDLWDGNFAGCVREEDLVGRAGYGGLDLSAVSDLTAWVVVFPHESGRLDVWCRFWCPEARLVAVENRYREQYQAWARAGLLTATPGNAIDYQYIRAQILEDASRLRIIDLNVDRLFQGYQLAMELADEGLTVIGMGQGFLSMAAPMKTFERLLLDRRLNHGGHAILRWMAGNVAVKQDPAGNLKPDKAESQGKIDGIVALVMALDRWERNENGPSVYEERDLLLL